ncbi:protein FAM205C [Talpa occidentalis]|uniref:protein FAM205C n=1 Tax=Talpa occidentalis TaxID=50954 RepID=UPI0023F80366|nr:protein FAM205C [Talpa occidentalis]
MLAIPCALGSVIIIAFITWRVTKGRQVTKLEYNRSCCRCHRKLKQRANDIPSRARGCSRKEAEKPRELLSVMKSQDWFPREGGVRRLLCADPCCNTCNAVALDIKHLLEGQGLQVPNVSGDTGALSSSLEATRTAVSQEDKKSDTPRALEKQAHINVLFPTLANRDEALERCLLQRRLQHQRGLPAAVQRPL